MWSAAVDTPPAPLDFFQWRFVGWFLRTVLKLYLLWWRVLGPLRLR